MSFKQHLALLASAGSGKTFALSIRYISLLLLGESVGSILAATFTKKAASEMSQRVLKFLNSFDDEAIIGAIELESGLSRDEIMARQEGALKRFLSEQNYIVTIDSFINSILRSSSLYMDIEPNYDVKDGIYDDLDRDLIVELESFAKLKSLVRLSLNLNKRRSKDVVELFRFLYDLDATLPPVEYKSVNLEPIVKSINKLRLETLEAVRASGASQRAINNFEESDFKKFITKGIFEKESLYEHNYYKKYLDSYPVIEENFHKLKELIASYHAGLEQNILHYLFDIYNHYKIARIGRLREAGVLDFSDILYLTYQLLSHHITKEFLYFKLDSKFKHILLDEFQDTSSLQFLILKPLIDEIFSGVGVSEFRSFFYVGDTKQSLYRFRGGVEELFEYVATTYGVEISVLDKNYRSYKGIVEAVNGWFDGKIDSYKPQIPISKDEGFVKVKVADEVLDGAIEAVERLTESGVKSSEIACLVFANKDAILLQEELKKIGIEAVLKTSSSLKSNPKIAALVGVLEYIVSGGVVADSESERVVAGRERVYLEPFLQKIGREFSEFELPPFRRSDKPYRILKELVQSFGYFDNDLNVLKLLDFAKDFSTIYDFLDEFKRSKIELSSTSLEGVTIMTIHGSKGLEFDYVVCLDRFGKGAPDTNLLLFKSKNPTQIEKIFYKHSKKELFVKEYADAKEVEKILKTKDKLNLLYVALTRAVKGLWVVKKEKGSEFDIIELDEIEKGRIEPSKELKKQEVKRFDIKLGSYGMQEVIEGEDEEGSKNYDAIIFGEALHYCLELVDFKSLDLKSAFDSLQNRYGLFLELEQLNEIKRRVRILIKCDEFMSKIGGKELFKEQPISYDGAFYQIDLLASDDSEYLIFDYKSSKKFATKHQKQVANYIEAIKTISGKESRGYLVYLGGDGVEIVEVK